MRELHIEGVEIPIYWTAWEFPNEATSGLVHKRTVSWVMQKQSRSASVWRLADQEKEHWYVVAVSEHGPILEALERRLRTSAMRHGGEWYEIDEAEVQALVMRRVGDALTALKSGQQSDLRSERHFKGRWRLRPDGTLEPVDRPQG